MDDSLKCLKMISIKHCDIPLWLHTGEFYRNLSSHDSDDDEELIEIPTDCFAMDDGWTNNHGVTEFCQLVRVALFWILDTIPIGVLEFCVRQDIEVWQSAMLSIPGAKESGMFDPMLEACLNEGKVPFDMVIKTGKLDLILVAARQITDSTQATFVAAEVGDLTVLQFLHEQGFEWNELTCRQASASGSLDILRYAHENGCPWDYYVHQYAAFDGHLHIMRYAYEQGLNEWHTDICNFAAFNGELECLQFAHENGCPWNYEVYVYAAVNSNLHILQYAHQQGLVWHEEVCKLAAMNGQLSCLKYAHENGCPWSKDTVRGAVLRNHVECLQYLLEQGCPIHEETCILARRNGYLNCLQLLDEYMR